MESTLINENQLLSIDNYSNSEFEKLDQILDLVSSICFKKTIIEKQKVITSILSPNATHIISIDNRENNIYDYLISLLKEAISNIQDASLSFTNCAIQYHEIVSKIISQIKINKPKRYINFLILLIHQIVDLIKGHGYIDGKKPKLFVDYYKFICDDPTDDNLKAKFY
jgi:hypothetical protein